MILVVGIRAVLYLHKKTTGIDRGSSAEVVFGDSITWVFNPITFSSIQLHRGAVARQSGGGENFTKEKMSYLRLTDGISMVISLFLFQLGR